MGLNLPNSTLPECNAPLVSCEGELSGLLSGHSICTAICSLKNGWTQGQEPIPPRVLTRHGRQVETQWSSVLLTVNIHTSRGWYTHIHIHTHTHTRTMLLLNSGGFMCYKWKVTSLMSHLCVWSTMLFLSFCLFLKQFSELYESSEWSSYYLRSGITAFRFDALTKSLLMKSHFTHKRPMHDNDTLGCNTSYTLCVTVKEHKGSMSSTGVNSPPRTTLQWRSRRPARRDCSAGFLAATSCSGTHATSSAITWSKMTTRSTCWVEALTVWHIHHQHMHTRGGWPQQYAHISITLYNN